MNYNENRKPGEGRVSNHDKELFSEVARKLCSQFHRAKAGFAACEIHISKSLITLGEQKTKEFSETRSNLFKPAHRPPLQEAVTRGFSLGASPAIATLPARGGQPRINKRVP